MKKPREFEIFNGETDEPSFVQYAGDSIAYAENITLIEKSAYLELKALADEMAKELQALEDRDKCRSYECCGGCGSVYSEALTKYKAAIGGESGET